MIQEYVRWQATGGDKLPMTYSQAAVKQRRSWRLYPQGAPWPCPICRLLVYLIWFCFVVPTSTWLSAQGTRGSTTYHRIKLFLGSIPAIDTHDRLKPFNRLETYSQTEMGFGMSLHGLLAAHYGWVNALPTLGSREPFDTWWAQAKLGFENARATTVYHEMLPAFRDLYGIDLNQITDEQARDLNRRIFENYKTPKWLFDVITERANIELMFIDPYWKRLVVSTAYPFQIPVLNVTSLVWGFHRSEFQPRFHSQYYGKFDNPYLFASERGLRVESLEDYLTLLDRIFAEAKQRGAVCIKNTLAYERTLQFENVPKEHAARAFGRPRSELTSEEVKEFEDFIMWRLVELSAKYNLPFQIHTGLARIQGSNPMLLVDLIEANPRTKFILFHGGFPWIDETGAIMFTELKHARNVWLDSVWMPSLSSTIAKRAYSEWLDLMPSDRIMWGTDQITAEGLYAAAKATRRCLAEVLADKVIAGDLREEDARRIGKQILRDNALALFPQLKSRLWKNASGTMQSQLETQSNRAGRG